MTTSRVNAMLRAVGAATAAFGVGAFLAGSATAAPWIMTFERMTTVAAGGADIANADVVDGQVVTNMWGPGSLNGIPGSDSRVSVTILADSNGNDVDRAVVYNSRPGTGRDPDLEARRNGATGFTYHGAEGAPVVASVDPQRGNGPDGKSNPGNILIIQENSDGCGDDVCNEPDDEAHGGKLTFVFDVPTSIFSIDVIDIKRSVRPWRVSSV